MDSCVCERALLTRIACGVNEHVQTCLCMCSVTLMRVSPKREKTACSRSTISSRRYEPRPEPIITITFCSPYHKIFSFHRPFISHHHFEKKSWFIVFFEKKSILRSKYPPHRTMHVHIMLACTGMHMAQTFQPSSNADCARS